MDKEKWIYVDTFRNGRQVALLGTVRATVKDALEAVRKAGRRGYVQSENEHQAVIMVQ